MMTRRIIPCLDVRAGKVTKGIAFKGNIDVGDPVEMARFYYESGADELVFYDITASNERRDIMIDVVSSVAAACSRPAILSVASFMNSESGNSSRIRLNIGSASAALPAVWRSESAR